MRRIFRPVGFVLVALYFAVDAVFSYVTRPFVGWIGKLPAFNGIRAWIVSLNAYSALALFAVPVMVLEPVKPLAAYLMATGHLVSGLGSLVGAEILQADRCGAALPTQPQQAAVDTGLRVGLWVLEANGGLGRILEGMAIDRRAQGKFRPDPSRFPPAEGVVESR